MHSLLISLPLFPSLTRSCQNPFLLNAGLPISCLHPNTKHSLIKIWKLARCIHFKFRATELRRSSALPNNPSIFSWSLYSHFNSLIPPFSHQSFNNCHLPLSWFLILFPWQNRSQQKKTSTSSPTISTIPSALLPIYSAFPPYNNELFLLLLSSNSPLTYWILFPFSH